jgi:hypothetical protein
MFDEGQIMYAGAQPHEADARLFVVFSQEARLDQAASTAEGRNIYRDVEFVTIRIPGDKTTSVHRPVRPSDKQRFPHQYAAFKNKIGEQVVGTPLSMWPGVTPSRAKELEYFNVRTVEQLAAMSDGVGGAQMMGIQALRAQAKQFVEHAKEQAPILKFQSELAERDATIAALSSQLAEQGKALDRILANLGKEEPEGKAKKQK